MTTTSYIPPVSEAEPQPFVKAYCPGCGSECEPTTTWCDWEGTGERTPIVPVLVRWTPEVLANGDRLWAPTNGQDTAGTDG